MCIKYLQISRFCNSLKREWWMLYWREWRDDEGGGEVSHSERASEQASEREKFIFFEYIWKIQQQSATRKNLFFIDTSAQVSNSLKFNEPGEERRIWIHMKYFSLFWRPFKFVFIYTFVSTWWWWCVFSSLYIFNKYF